MIPLFKNKIFEKLMHLRLTEFINDNNILNENQFCFQKNKSTDLVISSITANKIGSFENKEYAHCIFLDFAKAFGTVNNEILIPKLDYGIRGTSLKWLSTYLCERQLNVIKVIFRKWQLQSLNSKDIFITND